MLSPQQLLCLLFLFMLTFFISESRPYRLGDSPEYLAMGLQLSEFSRPSLSPEQLIVLEQRLQQLGPEYADTRLSMPSLRGPDGRQDFLHFWFYSALAVPWLWLVRGLGLHPNYAFAFLNATFLLAALWVVARRIHPAVLLLLFGGPILWWVDKAHTEVFTFSLLAMAFALLSEHPEWSPVCVGVAATQNMPIAIVLPLIVLGVLFARREALQTRRFWIGVGVGVALVLMHPIYYLARLGVVSPLGIVLHWPTVAELGATVWDPNIGLLWNFPLLAPVVVGAAVILIAHQRSRLLVPGIWIALASGLVFLFAFAQVGNQNHGGTRGISRYALWLVPLTLPLLQEAALASRHALRNGLAMVAVLSCLGSIQKYQPKKPEKYLTPTRAALVLWVYYPAVDNPLPEIFVERLMGRDGDTTLPVATATCSKVLLVEGHWPVGCPAASSPPQVCLESGALCYANRTEDGYDFAEAPLDGLHRRTRQSFKSK